MFQGSGKIGFNHPPMFEKKGIRDPKYIPYEEYVKQSKDHLMVCRDCGAPKGTQCCAIRHVTAGKTNVAINMVCTCPQCNLIC